MMEVSNSILFYFLSLVVLSPSVCLSSSAVSYLKYGQVVCNTIYKSASGLLFTVSHNLFVSLYFYTPLHLKKSLYETEPIIIFYLQHTGTIYKNILT
jgi:hypothetical protein